MPELKVKNQKGQDAGSLTLGDVVFASEKNAQVVAEVFNAFRNNQRQGTHSTRTRGTIRGGGRKPWRQKGTGRARHGSIRSNIWTGGSVAHGPLPRSYREKVNKKKRRAAFRAILTDKFEAGEIIVVDTLDFPGEPKTKSVVEFRGQVGAKGKTLIVTKEKDEALNRAARNLGGSAQVPTRVQVENAISVYDLLVCDTLIITRDAVQALEERLK